MSILCIFLNLISIKLWKGKSAKKFMHIVSGLLVHVCVRICINVNLICISAFFLTNLILVNEQKIRIRKKAYFLPKILAPRKFIEWVPIKNFFCVKLFSLKFYQLTQIFKIKFSFFTNLHFVKFKKKKLFFLFSVCVGGGNKNKCFQLYLIIYLN